MVWFVTYLSTHCSFRDCSQKSQQELCVRTLEEAGQLKDRRLYYMSMACRPGQQGCGHFHEREKERKLVTAFFTPGFTSTSTVQKRTVNLLLGPVPGDIDDLNLYLQAFASSNLRTDNNIYDFKIHFRNLTILWFLETIFWGYKIEILRVRFNSMARLQTF